MKMEKNNNLKHKDYSLNNSTKPFISLVLPAYNEETIIENNLNQIYKYLKGLEKYYRWEIIVVNDGSSDNTGEIADTWASSKENVQVLHHIVNLQIGQALRTGFSHCHGDYVVTMDIDLSYSPDHIEKLMQKIVETKAHIVIASPYMEGGMVSNVPFIRKFFSRWGNRFLSFFAKGGLHTLTSLVRVYNKRFLDSLNLKAIDVEINAEIIYKSMLLRARIEEIPSHLDWGIIKKGSTVRISSFKILKSILTYVISGFTFRPFMFFILPGFLIFLLSCYPLAWAFIHTIEELNNVPASVDNFYNQLSGAIGEAFKLYPHTFFVAGVALVIAFQLISLGLLALQSKRYFEDLFYLGSANYVYKMDSTIK
jgi:glycosyltransferase involved in cell wall biosynthesis